MIRRRGGAPKQSKLREELKPNAEDPLLAVFVKILNIFLAEQYTAPKRLPEKISPEISAAASWTKDTRKLPDSCNSLPISYEDHAQNGAAVLKLALFLMLRGRIRNKPQGYAQILVNVICSANLKRIVEKINPTLFVGVQHGEDALCAYIGMLWFQEGFQVERVANLISPLFIPILDKLDNVYAQSQYVVASNRVRMLMGRQPTSEKVDPYVRHVTSDAGHFVDNLEEAQGNRSASPITKDDESEDEECEDENTMLASPILQDAPVKWDQALVAEYADPIPETMVPMKKHKQYGPPASAMYQPPVLALQRPPLSPTNWPNVEHRRVAGSLSKFDTESFAIEPVWVDEYEYTR